MPPAPRRLAPFVVAALLTLASAHAIAGEAPVRRFACGAFDVVPSGFRSGHPARLSIQKAGRLLVTVADWSVTAAGCEELTGDRVPELVVRTASGGAGCCETVRVFGLGAKPRLLLLYQANHAPGAEARDIDGDGRAELILGDDTFAYFDDLSHAASPALPLVACFGGDRFADCTPRFPELLRDLRRRHAARLAPPAGDEAVSEARGAALGVIAASALLGEEDEGLRMVRDAVTDPRVTDWVKKALPRVRDWVTARGRKLKDGR